MRAGSERRDVALGVNTPRQTLRDNIVASGVNAASDIFCFDCDRNSPVEVRRHLGRSVRGQFSPAGSTDGSDMKKRKENGTK